VGLKAGPFSVSPIIRGPNGELPLSRKVSSLSFIIIVGLFKVAI
jgi:hypothetical protein